MITLHCISLCLASWLTLESFFIAGFEEGSSRESCSWKQPNAAKNHVSGKMDPSLVEPPDEPTAQTDILTVA